MFGKKHEKPKEPTHRVREAANGLYWFERHDFICGVYRDYWAWTPIKSFASKDDAIEYGDRYLRPLQETVMKEWFL